MSFTWPGASKVRQLPFRRLFTPLKRPVPPEADIVTAYTDGQVTLRSNRSKIGYHEAADLSGYQGVEPGDFVVHGLDILRGSVGVSDSSGAISAVCTVCKPGPLVEPRFVAHSIRMQAESGYTKAMARGIREGGADFRRWATLAELPVPVPPLEYQKGALAFLDRETTQIDMLIAEQRRLVEMLRERRKSVVAFAFLGRQANARMRAACHDIIDCRHTTPESDSGGIFEAVRTASVRDGKYRPGLGIRVNEKTWMERNRDGVPERGDVLFTREAPAGEACMVPKDVQVCLGQRMVLLKINRERAIGKFLVWQIYSDNIRNYFNASTNGSTVGNLRLGTIRNTPIWLPSVEEQRQIAVYLDAQTAKIDTLIAESERLIELSQERRSALITAAVTGQIDVRQEA